jgi:hypothetical protein
MTTDDTDAAGQPAPSPPPPTIHEATRAGGPSGAVVRGVAIDEATAVARRRAGEDVVVCGDDVDANRRLAWRIEAGAGPPSRPQSPHKLRAGPHALPHFQQAKAPPEGHTFYETANRKARKKP